MSVSDERKALRGANQAWRRLLVDVRSSRRSRSEPAEGEQSARASGAQSDVDTIGEPPEETPPTAA